MADQKICEFKRVAQLWVELGYAVDKIVSEKMSHRVGGMELETKAVIKNREKFGSSQTFFGEFKEETKGSGT